MNHSGSVLAAIVVFGTVALPMMTVGAEDSASAQRSANPTASDPETKVIYGVDDRLDIFEVTNPTQLELSSSVCAVVYDTLLNPVGEDFKLSAFPYTSSSLPPCIDEPFRDQSTGAFCTAFLVADDLVVTAGHCNEAPLDLADS